jgi:hypothetical protein
LERLHHPFHRVFRPGLAAAGDIIELLGGGIERPLRGSHTLVENVRLILQRRLSIGNRGKRLFRRDIFLL